MEQADFIKRLVELLSLIHIFWSVTRTGNTHGSPAASPAMRSNSVRAKSVKWRRLSARETNASQDSCGKA